MQKKKTIITIVVILVLSLVGVAGAFVIKPMLETKTIINKIVDVAKWEKYKEESDFTFSFKSEVYGGEKPFKITIPLKVSSAKDSDKIKTEAKIDTMSLIASLNQRDRDFIKNIISEYLQVSENGFEELDSLKEINLLIFQDKDKIILKKSGIPELISLLLPAEITEAREDYIGFNIDDVVDETEKFRKFEQTKEYLKSNEFSKDFNKLVKYGLKEFNSSAKIEKKENSYSYETSINEIAKDIQTASKLLLENKNKTIPLLTKIINKSGISEITEEEMLKRLNKIKENKIEDEDELKNIKLKITVNFGEENFNCQLSFTTSFKYKIQANINITKDDSVNIEIPENIKILTKEELSDLGIK